MTTSRQALTAIALLTAGTLSLAAQQPAPVGLSARAGAGAVGATATVSKAAVTRVRTNALTTIQGNALNSTNGAMPDALVRLRDARFGRIVDTQLTDQSGLFAFKAIDPGTYIVEVIGSDQSSVLAASQILNVNAGDAVSAVVKLPFRIPPFAGILAGNSTTATAVASEAAASSIAAIVPTSPVSPTQ